MLHNCDRGTMRWPGTIEPGEVADDLIDFSDFLPTLAEAGRADLPENVKLDGISFLGRLLGKAEDARLWAFADCGNRHRVRARDWKLYNNGKFFNMKTDPREQYPIAEGGLSKEAAAAKWRLEEVMQSLGI